MPYKLAGCVGKYRSLIQRESDQKLLTYQEVVDILNRVEELEADNTKLRAKVAALQVDLSLAREQRWYQAGWIELQLERLLKELAKSKEDGAKLLAERDALRAELEHEVAERGAEITRLLAERDALRAQAEEMPYYSELQAKVRTLKDKLSSYSELQAEVKRLRAELASRSDAEREPVIWWVSRDAAPGCRIEVWNERPIQNIGGTFYGEKETGLLFSVAEAAALGIECEPGECFRFDLANRRRAE